MVFSASYPTFGVTNFLKQVAWLGLGIVALIAMARIPYEWWQRFAIPIMIVALGLLAAVLIFGDDRRRCETHLPEWQHPAQRDRQAGGGDLRFDMGGFEGQAASPN